MVLFNKIGHFGAIEIFGVEPFVMLGIDSGWPEKLVRFLSPNQDWRIRTKHDPDGHFSSPMVRRTRGVYQGNWGTDGQRQGTGNGEQMKKTRWDGDQG